MSLGVYNYCASFYLEMRDEKRRKKNHSQTHNNEMKTNGRTKQKRNV